MTLKAHRYTGTPFGRPTTVSRGIWRQRRGRDRPRGRVTSALRFPDVLALGLLAFASSAQAYGEATALAPNATPSHAPAGGPVFMVRDFGVAAKDQDRAQLCRLVPDLISAALADVTLAPSRVFRSRDIASSSDDERPNTCPAMSVGSARAELDAVAEFKSRYRAERWIVISGDFYSIEDEIILEIDIEANDAFGHLEWSDEQYSVADTYDGLVAAIRDMAEDVRIAVERSDVEARNLEVAILAHCFMDQGTESFILPLFDWSVTDKNLSNNLRSMMVGELKSYLTEMFPGWNGPNVLFAKYENDCEFDRREVTAKYGAPALTLQLFGEYRRERGELHVVTYLKVNAVEDRRAGPVFVVSVSDREYISQTVQAIADRRANFRLFATAALLADLEESDAVIRERVRATWVDRIQPEELLEPLQRASRRVADAEADVGRAVVDLTNVLLIAGRERAALSEIERLHPNGLRTPYAWAAYLSALNANGRFEDVVELGEEGRLPAGVAGPGIDRELGIAAWRIGDRTAAIAKLESAFGATNDMSDAVYLFDLYASLGRRDKIVKTLQRAADAAAETGSTTRQERLSNVALAYARRMIGEGFDRDGNDAFEVYLRFNQTDTARVIELGRNYLAKAVTDIDSWRITVQDSHLQWAFRHLKSAIDDIRECVLNEGCNQQLGGIGTSALPVLHLETAEACLLMSSWECAVIHSWLAEEGFAGRVATSASYLDLSTKLSATSELICSDRIAETGRNTTVLQRSNSFGEVSRYYKLLSCDMRQNSHARLQGFIADHVGGNKMPARSVYATGAKEPMEIVWNFRVVDVLADRIQAASERRKKGSINGYLADSIRTSLLAFNRQ